MNGWRLAFVDLETTGATANADRITEIGIVAVDEDGGESRWSSLINPHCRIPPFIESLTGISNAMVAEAPDFPTLADEISERLAGRIFVAHNARFDYGFLKNEFARLGVEFRATVVCTVKLSRRLYPQHHKHNLDSLIARHGLVVDGRHRALGDALAIARFWQIAKAETTPERFGAALKMVMARPSLPEHLDAAAIDGLPESAGVYVFRGENQLPLYVGKSKNLRRRVLAHFAGDHASAKAMSLARQVRHIECIETGGELGALLTEARLIKTLQPLLNRVARRSSQWCAWRYEVAGEGVRRPRLAMADEPGFAADGGDYFGLFKTPRDALAALRAVADANGLCHAQLGLETPAAGQACFAHQLRKCRGACVGKETADQHHRRVLSALAKLRLADWPFSAAALLREGEDWHVIAHWRYLGCVRDEAGLAEVLAAPPPGFDADIYRLLVRHAERLTALPAGCRLASAEFHGK